MVHAAAESEFRAALDYYSQISPELGVRFFREIERLTQEVCDRPDMFRQYDPPARRHFTDRFPYGVVYVVVGDCVWILAVMHLHREPGYWQERVG